MRRIRIVAILATLAMAAAIPAGAGGPGLTADLSPGNEVPATESDASGTADVIFNNARGELCVHIKAGGFEGEVIAGHIHESPAGVNGPVVVNLEVDSPRFKNCVAVDAELLAAIQEDPSSYYINIHTTAFPGGEIRGQLSN